MSGKDKEYVQLNDKIVSPTGAESKIIEDAKNDKDWASGQGNGVKAMSGKDKAYIQVDKKERQTTNTSEQVAADLKKQEA